jgi:hypothetical protein
MAKLISKPRLPVVVQQLLQPVIIGTITISWHDGGKTGAQNSTNPSEKTCYLLIWQLLPHVLKDLMRTCKQYRSFNLGQYEHYTII